MFASIRRSSPPPGHGDHGQDILREAGFGDAEIQDLVAGGAVTLGKAPA